MGEVCQYLTWDSEFFGFRIAQVQAKKLNPADTQAVFAWCQANDIRCAYFLAAVDDPETIKTVEKAGYHFADARLTMELQPLVQQSPAPLPPGLAIRPAVLADIPALQVMAGSSYTLSRFYFDPGFPRQRCSELYQWWIEKNCREEFSLVLMASFEKQPAGFISASWDAAAKTGKIGLLGVSAEVRGRGIGQRLMEQCLANLELKGINKVEAVTQMRNIGAQRVNQRAGFIASSVELWYHKWF